MKKIPDHLTGKALIKWLIDNKTELIQQKKSCMKFTEPFSCMPEILTIAGHTGTKASGDNEDQNNLTVKIVGNTAWWCDGGMDVLTDTCWDESLKAKLSPHIADHEWKSTSHVGDVIANYKQTMNLTKLGLDKPGRATVCCWETDVRKDYNPKVFQFYKNGKINQHSIGLMYLDIQLAVNNEEYANEYAVWKKNIDKVINKEMAEAQGYFWLVTKIKLMEVSCVLFGMNELTPTISSSFEEPEEGKTTGGKPASATPARTKMSTLDFKSMIIN